jgi:hypothetical protein
MSNVFELVPPPERKDRIKGYLRDLANDIEEDLIDAESIAVIINPTKESGDPLYCGQVGFRSKGDCYFCLQAYALDIMNGHHDEE